MSYMFEWHPQKAVSNIAKHGMAFEEAQTVFADPFAAIFPDEDHSNQEEREIIVGHSALQRLLLVSFTQRGEIIRIISVRRATIKERREYEEGTNI